VFQDIRANNDYLFKLRGIEDGASCLRICDLDLGFLESGREFYYRAGWHPESETRYSIQARWCYYSILSAGASKDQDIYIDCTLESYKHGRLRQAQIMRLIPRYSVRYTISLQV
jgi:hypothetical protein